jgi:hypothetical protein
VIVGYAGSEELPLAGKGEKAEHVNLAIQLSVNTGAHLVAAAPGGQAINPSRVEAAVAIVVRERGMLAPYSGSRAQRREGGNFAVNYRYSRRRSSGSNWIDHIPSPELLQHFLC